MKIRKEVKDAKAMRDVGAVATLARHDREGVALQGAGKKGAVAVAKTKIGDGGRQVAFLAEGRWMHGDDVIVIHADMIGEPPIGFDLAF